MAPDAEIARRIARSYPELTDALKQFADFVLTQPVKAARLSIRGAVAEVGVSVATANRFARAIGFSGYPEFRAELIQSFESAFEPVERLKKQISKQSSHLEVISASLEEDIHNLQMTLQHLTGDSTEKAVDFVLKSKRIFVLGLGYIAGMFASALEQSTDDVTVLANSAVAAVRQLSRLKTGDLVIVIAFPRYTRDTIELARIARTRGVPMVAITDSPRSPLTAMADVTLFAHAERQFASTSNASILALLEGFAAAVAQRRPEVITRAEAFAELAVPWFEPGHAEAPQVQAARKKRQAKRV